MEMLGRCYNNKNKFSEIDLSRSCQNIATSFLQAHLRLSTPDRHLGWRNNQLDRLLTCWESRLPFLRFRTFRWPQLKHTLQTLLYEGKRGPKVSSLKHNESQDTLLTTVGCKYSPPRESPPISSFAPLSSASSRCRLTFSTPIWLIIGPIVAPFKMSPNLSSSLTAWTSFATNWSWTSAWTMMLLEQTQVCPVFLN